MSNSFTAKGRIGKAIASIGQRFKLFGQDETKDDLYRDIGNISMNDIIGSDIFNKNGIEISPKTFKTFSDNYLQWVYTAINKKGSTIASMKYGLYSYKNSTGKFISGHAIKQILKKMNNVGERKIFLKSQNLEKVEITESPFIDLMKKPNPVQPRYSFVYDIVMKLELSGAAPILLNNNNAIGQPEHMYVLPLKDTAEFKIIPDEKNVIGGYIYTDGKINRTLSLDEVIYIHYPSPKSIYEAYSPLLAQSYAYDIDLFLSQYQYAMFKNKTNFGNALTTDEKLTDAQVKQLRALVDAQKGAANSGKTVVYHSGLKPGDRMALNMQESMVDVLSDNVRSKILSGYGTPAGKVGIVTDVNRANMEALDHTYYTETIQPTTMLIEEYIETGLLPRYDDRLELDFELPDTRDRIILITEREKNLVTGYSTINEERQKDGYDPVEWGDAPWMSMGMTQWTPTMEADREAARAELDKPVNDTEDDTEEETEKKKSLTEQNSKSLLWKKFAVRQEQYENKFFEITRRHFIEQETAVISWFNQNGHRIAGNINGWSQKKKEQWFSKADRFTDLNPIDDANKWAKEFYSPLKRTMSDQGNYRLAELVKQHVLPSTAGFNVNDPKVKKYLADKLKKFSEEVAGTTFTEIKNILKQGFEAGDSITTITQTLRDRFGIYEKHRAMMIARTETVAAMNRADLEAVEQEGLGGLLLKEWLVADTEARDTHLAAASMYGEGGDPGPIELDEYFHVGSDRMLAPGGGSVAGEVINCRCSIAYSRKPK